MSTKTHAGWVRADFLTAYKAIYLAAILANLAALLFEKGFNYGLLQIYLIGILVFVVNTTSWLGYQRGRIWAFELEEALSIGRMTMAGLASTVFFADVVALFSPVGWILWYKVMFSVMGFSFILYWFGCAVLLALEGFYLYSLRRSRGQIDVPVGAAVAG